MPLDLSSIIMGFTNSTSYHMQYAEWVLTKKDGEEILNKDQQEGRKPCVISGSCSGIGRETKHQILSEIASPEDVKISQIAQMKDKL